MEAGCPYDLHGREFRSSIAALLDEPRPRWPCAAPAVLLAEDNEMNQQIACELLCDAGLVVDVAHNGERKEESTAPALRPGADGHADTGDGCVDRHASHPPHQTPPADCDHITTWHLVSSSTACEQTTSLSNFDRPGRAGYALQVDQTT
jgi:hypothetical protein